MYGFPVVPLHREDRKTNAAEHSMLHSMDPAGTHGQVWDSRASLPNICTERPSEWTQNEEKSLQFAVEANWEFKLIQLKKLKEATSFLVTVSENPSSSLQAVPELQPVS